MRTVPMFVPGIRHWPWANGISVSTVRSHPNIALVTTPAAAICRQTRKLCNGVSVAWRHARLRSRCKAYQLLALGSGPVQGGHSAAAAGPLRIAHAPNHTHFKGSKYLEQAIERLRAQGYEIEYRKFRAFNNAEVLALFAASDVVADQFVGGACGYTALEAMALGKPVLSFVRGRDLVEAPEECPIINATPDDLDQALLWIIRNREILRAIGAQGRRYVERWHSVSAVAARLGQLYCDTADFP